MYTNAHRHGSARRARPHYHVRPESRSSQTVPDDDAVPAAGADAVGRVRRRATGGRRRRFARGAGRQHPAAGRRVRRRGGAQQDRTPRLDVPGHTVRAAARRRPAVRAARHGPAAVVERRAQRVRAHARLHPGPAGPAAPRSPAVRVRRRAAGRPDPHVRGLSVPERLQAGR